MAPKAVLDEQHVFVLVLFGSGESLVKHGDA